MDQSADQIPAAKMAPKNKYDPNAVNGSGNGDLEESDLQELEAVDESLDELSTVLDVFEQRTDNIMQQLKDLLHSIKSNTEDQNKPRDTLEGENTNAME